MWTEEKLNTMLTTPSAALAEELAALDGDILVLGAGGKMGPTLCTQAKNALRAAGSDRRVIAVSRFSDPLAAELLRAGGVELGQRRPAAAGCAGKPARRRKRRLHGRQKIWNKRQRVCYTGP